VNVLKIDRRHPGLELTTSLGHGKAMGLSALSEQVQAIPGEVGQPIAAVNGDFYTTEHARFQGDPRGLQIMRGEVVSAPDGKTAFWINADGQPQIGNVASQFSVMWPEGETLPFGLNEERQSHEAVLYTPRSGSSTRASGGRELVLMKHGNEPWLPFRAGETYSAEVKDVRESGNTRLSSDTVVLSIGPMLVSRVPRVKSGAVLRISMETTPDLRGVQTAVGGGPVLLHNGKVPNSFLANKAYDRHPRSAVGWNDDYFFFVQVDGRQPGFSIGMKLPELSKYMAGEGCKEAMNLDGGGSSEMWVAGQVVNRPCFGYERSTANGLVVVKREKLAQR
jgi:hypothetical protein